MIVEYDQATPTNMITKATSKHRYDNHSKAWIYALIALLTVILTEQVIEYYEQRSAFESERANALSHLAAVRAKLEGVINSNLLLVHGITAVISANPDIKQDYFAQIAEGLFRKNTALRNIAAAPDMVISMVYPMEGNKEVLGLNYLSHPAQRSAAIRARDSDQAILAGPIPLVQGGTGIILREPVFILDDPDDIPWFWGLVSSVIDVNTLYRQAGIDTPQPHYLLAIRGRDGTGAEGPVFYGDENLFSANPVTSEITLPGGAWQLAAIPVNGWNITTTTIWIIRLLGLLLAIATSMGIYLIFRSKTILTQTNTKLNTLLDTIPDLVWLKDPKGVYLTCNPRFEQLIGLKKSELKGKTDYDLVTKELADFYRSKDQATLDSGISTITEEWMTFVSDGHKELAETIKTPVLGSDGNVIGVLGIARDITDRKHAVQHANKLNRLYAVLSGINEAIIRLREPEALYREACRIAVEAGNFRMAWLGLVDESENTIKHVVHAGEVSGYLDHLQISLANDELGRGPTGEALRQGTHAVCNDIENNPCMKPWRDAALTRGYRASAAFPLIVNGKIRGAFNLYADTPGFFDETELRLLDELANNISFALEFAENETQRREHEQEIKRLHALLNALVEEATDSIFVKDRDGRYIVCNKATCHLLGKTREQILFHTDFDLFPKELAQRFRDDDLRIQQARITENFEEPVITSKGTSYHLTTKGPLIIDGAISGVFGISRDISDRKQTERELLQQKDLLERTGSLAKVGGWQFDVATMNGSLSAETARIFDLEQNSQQINVAQGINHYIGESRALIEQAIQDAIEHGKAYDLELEIETKRGASKWVHTMGKPVFEHGKVVRIQGAIQDITSRKQAEILATQRELMLDSVFQAIPDLFFLMDKDGTILDYRAQKNAVLYIPPESFLGRRMTEIMPENISKLFMQNFETLYQQNKLVSYEYDMTLPDGEHRYEARMNKLSESTQCVAIIRDITDQYHARKALLESETRYRSLLENAPFPVVLTRIRDGILRYGNNRAELRFGITRENGIGQAASRFYQDPDERQNFLEHLLRDGSVYEQEVRMMDIHGQPFWALLSASIVDFENEPTIFTAINDITKHKKAEEDIRHLVHYDALTGLPNRTLLNDRIEHAISMAERNKQPVALMFIDLDRFKNINDSLGHQAGDQMLIEVAKRLKLVVRKEDTVSRLGGDEFILLLPNTNFDGAAHVAEKIIQSMSKPFLIHQHDLGITPSIGIAIYPNDGVNPDSLMQCADSAMYRAKRTGHNTFCFFTAEMHVQASRTLQLENALRRALQRNELLLHYQPQIDIASQEIIGCEALLRWNHPDFGMVSPAEFIPIAEDSGQILTIGEWVLRTAVQQNYAWQKAGLKPLVMAVNISAVQFRQIGLTALVNQILHQYKLPSKYLELELTESITMEDPVVAVDIMERLHKQGIKLSIDDFGTGYSSLSYLKRFKINKLKIDQSFVRNIINDSNDEAIASAVIKLAQSLNLRTIAEGVETQQQLDILRSKGCNEIQGYFISKPLTADQFEAMLRSHQQNLNN